MATTHQSRIFGSGPATTLYVTIPAHVVTDSRFPFERDADVSVTIDGDRLVITSLAEDGTG